MALSFSYGSFNSFLLKPVFFTKTALSFLLDKVACVNLAATFSDVNLLNYCVVIYLILWSWLVTFFSISLIFAL